MKALLVALLLIVALLVVGFFVLPVLLAQVPAIGVGLGLVLVLAGLLWPTKTKCAGLHCPGCSDHH